MRVYETPAKFSGRYVLLFKYTLEYYSSSLFLFHAYGGFESGPGDLVLQYSYEAF
jgi:hypothetical protein